jgi:hypothetical protein
MTVSPLGWSVDQPDTGNGDVGLGGSGTSPGPFANQTIAAHFPPANASRTIGYLPDFAVILNLKVIVYEAFNGSPSLIVRIQGAQARYMSAMTTALATVGAKDGPAGSGANAGPDRWCRPGSFRPCSCR